jgi:high-affinity nickel-transport protein
VWHHGSSARAALAAPKEIARGKGGAAIDNLPVIVLGLLLGMRHATDPDHVVAVATIVSRQRTTRSAALIGALWGVGHTATIMVVGGAIILFDVAIPPRVGLTMEFGVALMLIVLGILNVASPLRPLLASAAGPVRGAALHAHPHGHGDYVHTHVHGHDAQSHGHAESQHPLARLDRALGGVGGYRAIRPLVVGLVHGLAGSAAVALLVLAAIRDPLWASAYLLLFGAGTIAGMMLITVVIAVPFAFTAARFATVHRYLGVASGLVSLGVGLFLAYEIGLVDGLFTATPSWTPK